MELPEELWQRVLLCPLPVRTLLRARAVCRQVKSRVPEIPVNDLDATQLFCVRALTILKNLSHSQLNHFVMTKICAYVVVPSVEGAATK
eukprot:3800356-Pyramimonas_sp.AAC.1